MKLASRWKFIGAILLGMVFCALLAWFLATRPDGVEALRSRLMGEDARGVEAILGKPDVRENGEKQWLYMDEASLKRFADKSVASRTIVVEFDDDGTVCKVYLTD